MFRDETPECRACGSGLSLVGPRWSCEQCGSVLVPAASVEEMMNELSPDDLRSIDERLVTLKGAATRACPRCPATMAVYALHGITVDRCVAHGIWFDTGELMAALNANAVAFADRHPKSPRGAAIPLGIGVIVGALLGPWLDRRRLRKDIERTSPKKPKG